MMKGRLPEWNFERSKQAYRAPIKSAFISEEYARLFKRNAFWRKN